MTHKFEPSNKSKLDNEWRRQNLPPLAVLEKLGLTSSDIVADIGCGIGYFTIPAAEVCSLNKVFALDTSDEMLVEVERRASLADVSNIVCIKSSEYDLKLPNSSVTFALLVNVLHEIDGKERFIDEIRRVLKPGDKIAIIEWKKELMEMGPPVEDRIAESELKELLEGNDFTCIVSMEFASSFYGAVAVKS